MQLRGAGVGGIALLLAAIVTLPGSAQKSPELAVAEAERPDGVPVLSELLEVPTSSSIRSLGLRPSAFLDVGSVWNLTTPRLENILAFCTPKTAGGPAGVVRPGDPPCDTNTQNSTPGFREFYLGDSPKPRLSVGIGVNWTSPFGPLRIDIAKALLKQEGDDTKLFSFNVGTAF